MALWSTQPLTEMCTRNLPGSKGLPVRKADSLTAISEPHETNIKTHNSQGGKMVTDWRVAWVGMS
jgi:hypothetical protein